MKAVLDSYPPHLRPLFEELQASQGFGSRAQLPGIVAFAFLLRSLGVKPEAPKGLRVEKYATLTVSNGRNPEPWFKEVTRIDTELYVEKPNEMSCERIGKALCEALEAEGRRIAGAKFGKIFAAFQRSRYGDPSRMRGCMPCSHFNRWQRFREFIVEWYTEGLDWDNEDSQRLRVHLEHGATQTLVSMFSNRDDYFELDGDHLWRVQPGVDTKVVKKDAGDAQRAADDYRQPQNEAGVLRSRSSATATGSSGSNSIQYDCGIPGTDIRTGGSKL